MKQPIEFEKIGFRLHPRVFSSLGADLVTNDIVALIELVKNSYDAFAENVWLRFKKSKSGESFLEIEDDGLGMTKEIIEQVWCLVATPYKQDNPYAGSGNKKRRVAGEKGLGRLSAARLGSRLRMITQAPDNPCWEVRVNWDEIANTDNLDSCYVQCREYSDESPFESSGTILRIFDLHSDWEEDQIYDLEDNLGRLISPFTSVGTFNIRLSGHDEKQTEACIESPEFLSKPKYSFIGKVDEHGAIKGVYAHNPISEGKPRSKNIELSWPQIFESIIDRSKHSISKKSPACGPFSFELRAWDIGSEDTQEIADKFDLQKNRVRKAIRAHKGISVYRDGILVLPKSENSRDWLGLDLRRISKVGTRLSTSQIVGYVAITADENPDIEDTSDRERLVSKLAVIEFQEILKTAVAMLENERDIDRLHPQKSKPLENLFGELSAQGLVDEVSEIAESGGEVSEVIPIVKAFNTHIEGVKKNIQERFVYYSRMATIGTIAQMLVHEIRNRSTSIGSFINYIKARFWPFSNDPNMKKEYSEADKAIGTLERLADTFAPLASRGFRRGKRSSIIEERIASCLNLLRKSIESKKIEITVPKTETQVAIDPGELDTIILNLITNALYWINQGEEKTKRLSFSLEEKNKRVFIWVNDSGSGIKSEDAEKVFWPGFTRKPGGLGMGLTVASELVNEHGGKMGLKIPGVLGGASFVFDLPGRQS